MPGGSRVLRTAGRAVGLSFRLLPKRLRFRAAVPVARALEPLLGRTGAARERLRQRGDTLREISLDLVLTMLTRYGATFDPVVDIEGAELPSRGPLLIVGHHQMLGLLILRLLHDRGADFALLAIDTGLRIPGTRAQPPSLEGASKTLLLRVREHLRAGRIVIAAIDRADPEPRNEIYMTRRGPVRFSHALLRVAEHCGAPVLFMATWLNERGEIVMRLTPAQAQDAQGVLAEFIAFLDATPAPAPASPP